MFMKRRVTLSVLWAGAGSWGREATGFLVFLFLVRLLGPEAYGLVGMATVVVAVAQVLVSEIVQDPLIQRDKLEPGHLDAAFWVLLALAVGLMLAVIAAAEPVAVVFDEPAVAELIRWLSILPVLSALQAVPTALLKRTMRYGVLAARSLLAVIGGGTVGIALAIAGYGPLSLVGHLLTQSLVGVLTLWTASAWRPGLRAEQRHFRELGRPGSYMLAIRLTLLVQQQSPRVLIGYFLGPVSVGLYTVSLRVIEILYLLLIRPVSDVALPTFAGLRDDMKRFRQTLHAARRLTAMVALPTFAGLALVAPTLLPMLLGNHWEGAISVVQLLALQGVCMSIFSVSRAVPQALGRWDVTLTIRLLATVLIVAAIVGVREAGLVAVAAAMAAGTSLMIPVDFYVVRRLTGTPFAEQARAYMPILGAALIMAGAVIAWCYLMAGSLSGLPLLTTTVLLGAAVYLASLLVTAFPLVRQAWQLLADLRGSVGVVVGVENER